ncbi:Stf0 sulfotransferase family protein [Aquibium sp. A9E412]|uniref:Stf0 family sulfotransferase n=1 Tax=Aquibium sp. A9E412 TaxID=2976767 RepID=UPI0025B27463|nr:Stf0 family sulfotransferase [Aquibium sp. A9E412]MDN2566094.1 Stf0 sulfotransferase family protein [Aquibium sp. A9E412]
MYDEVCNPHAVPAEKSEASFFRFLQEWIKQDPSFISSPSYEKKKVFSSEYFNHLLSKSGTDSIVIDIKYGHVHNFESFWWPIFRKPSLFSYCEELGIRVIHLFRENVVEAAVSAFIANENKIWHSWQKGSELHKERTHLIPVKKIISDAKLLKIQNRWFSNWMRDLPLLTFTYEEIDKNLNADNDEIMKKISDHVAGVYSKPYTPKLKKLGKPLRESVSNFDELAKACQGTAFEGMV